MKTHCKRGHEFTSDNTYVYPKNGHRQCLTCRKMYVKQNYEAKTAEKLDWHKQNYKKNRTSILETKRIYRANKRHLEVKYKLVTSYKEIVLSQNGVCAACGNPPEGQFHVDHDHSCCNGSFSCGKCVRGLLCPNCNKALGNVNDSIERLEMLIQYLQKSRGTL